jgi:hypothetical protein
LHHQLSQTFIPEIMKTFAILKTNLLLCAILICSLALKAQHACEIKGNIVCNGNGDVIPFASIALLDAADSLLLAGTTSDMVGAFALKHPLNPGPYFLRVTHVGYEPLFIELAFTGETSQVLGALALRELFMEMKEFVVMGERIKARVEHNLTTYYMNSRIYEVSHSGANALQYVPGLQIDIMQNISFQGSQNVIILVDGRRRDLGYVRQLDASEIDRVEVKNVPDLQHDGTVDAVINIVLRERASGMGGYIYADVPTSGREVYVFPTFNLQYGLKRFHFFTSYSGEISRFDIIESVERDFAGQGTPAGIRYFQDVRQNNWSHRINVGVDFHASEKSQLGFYGFFNPFSQEHDGSVSLSAIGTDYGNLQWNAAKEDNDRNRRAFASLFFKHQFNPGHSITLDAAYYTLNASHTTTYTSPEPVGDIPQVLASTVKPMQGSLIFTMDYAARLPGGWSVHSGLQTTFRQMHDRLLPGFEYREEVLAAYGRVDHSGSNYQVSSGLRAEKAVAGLTAAFSNRFLEWLPQASVSINPRPGQNIRLAYRKSVQRPGLYQLNPAIFSNDPFSQEQGNPDLKPEARHDVSLAYSRNFGDSFLSFQLFSRNARRVINELTTVTNGQVFETQMHNLGDISLYGLQLSGAIKVSKVFSLNPYFRVFHLHATPDAWAQSHGLSSKKEIAFESGWSAMANLRGNWAAGVQGQYSSPRSGLQKVTFSDALYFVSIHKTFGQHYMLGLSSALPFSRSFNYHGSRAEGPGFSMQSQGNIQMSAVPLMLKFSYRFHSGKRLNRIERDIQPLEEIRRRGF